ncbi:CDP-archaeol synthase [Maribellus comscasis]|uniref:Phosphatidate cytidylyltransferase n=1 Tax=Maribellus comscasis TaxID=2681766 RepID=A0A6I6K046_9BACT|nr:CDP-archaeol synthase [Maribellus comscasis]QGY43264.1 CDP-archaeol synthase [Maribellus comscasis]
MNNLLKRSLTGIIYVAVILAGTMIHPAIFALVFLPLMVVTQLEFYILMKNGDFNPQKIIGLVTGGLLFAACYFAARKIIPFQFCLLIFPFLIIILLSEVLRKKENSLQNNFITISGFIYVAIPFALLNFIVFPGFPENSQFYPWILTGLFFIIWIYDSMAYLIGSKFGKHKMCERISPNKSWEGLIGGAVFAVIMGILNAVIFQSLSVTVWIVTAALVVLFGTFGDLFESKIKRELKIKDSGNILPGHGGFLDRLDSLLFVIPVIYVWLILGGNIS